MPKPNPTSSPSFRFSLLALFGFVTFMAIACAALARPTALWVSVIQGIAFVSLFFAVLAVIYGQQASRAFWVGFAVVGWGYMGAQQFLITDAAERPTVLIAKRLQELIHPAKTPIGSKAVDSATTTAGPLPTNWMEMSTFLKITGWLWPLLLGFIGGIFARQLYRRREREKAMPNN